MKSLTMLAASITCFFLFSSSPMPFAQEIQETKISDRVSIFVDPEDGAKQLALSTENGIVVFDSLWSTIASKRFRKAITASFEKKEIVYTLNTVDRPDYFGGNAAYLDSVIVGHDSFASQFTPASASAEIKELIEMWRSKADSAKKRLATHDPGSEKEKSDRAWMNTCNRRANEMESGFELILPSLRYRDRISLDLGDVTLSVIFFGRARYEGLSVVSIPEERLAILPEPVLHPKHLAPYPNPQYIELDVPRWIAVLEEVLSEGSPIDRVIVGMMDVWSKDRALAHLHYIKELWKTTQEAAAQGMDVEAVQELCSLDGKFSFVKDLQVYKETGDRWVRMQHEAHTQNFFLQHGQEPPTQGTSGK